MRGRCDHDPKAPRLVSIVEPIGNQPWIIREAIKRAERLYHRPREFPELTGHHLAGRTTRLRSRRSSRREAWALMAASIFRHTDRRTFRIGDQRDDGLCNGVSVKRYRMETGLSPWRINATLRDFEGAAFIVTKVQPVELLRDKKTGAPVLDAKGNPRHRAFPAQRIVTQKFFERFGFTEEKIKKNRSHAAKAWAARRAPPASAVAIIEGRRTLKRLMRRNRQRNARLAGGIPPEAPAPAPVRKLTPARLVNLNAEREARLQALPPPDSGPPPKPRS